jgi:arylsulfatase A-like enzyme
VLQLDNLDRLRAEGTSFERCYASSPVCAGARVALRTGLFPHANPGSESLRADTPTVHARLKERGYRTHYVGKWHLSAGSGTASGYVLPQFRPDWDTFVGHEVSHSAHVTFEGEDPTPIPTGEWDAEVMTDFALDRIRADAAAGRPFYLQLNYLAPHQPYQDYPAALATYSQAQAIPRGNVPVINAPDFLKVGFHYMNATRGVDLELGRLLDALDALETEVVVIFTSDHGDMLYSHGETYKRSPYEESERIPLVVRGPGWRAGARVRYPVGQVDLAMTLCGLGQGLDLREPRDSVCFEMEQAAGSWKQGRWRGIVSDDGWKLAVGEGGGRLLSDLSSDPLELKDLAGKGLPQEDDLLARLRAWAHDTGDAFFG